MQMIALLVRTKLDQIVSQNFMRKLESEVLHIINIAGSLTTQRSQVDLIKFTKITIPPFFGFEGASILLKDVKTNLLFTINEITKDNKDEKLQEKFEVGDACAPEMRRTVKITYPPNIGISGQVFNNKEICF